MKEEEEGVRSFLEVHIGPGIRQEFIVFKFKERAKYRLRPCFILCPFVIIKVGNRLCVMAIRSCLSTRQTLIWVLDIIDIDI